MIFYGIVANFSLYKSTKLGKNTVLSKAKVQCLAVNMLNMVYFSYNLDKKSNYCTLNLVLKG